MMMMFVEITGFNNKNNYSWVRRYEQEIHSTMSDLAIVRLAKKLAGWNGIRCKTTRPYSGDKFTLQPVGVSEVMFISFVGS